MPVRQPVRAGAFYEASPSACRAHAQQLLDEADLPRDLPASIAGGLVPHAGWAFSGSLAALTMRAIAEVESPDTVVLFGADHTGRVRLGEVYASGSWQTPIGDVPVDEDLADELLQAGDDLMRSNPDAHAMEHSLEVQVPLLKLAMPETRILPIAVPPASIAVAIGQAVGDVLASWESESVCLIGSTDLTHHGGHFPAPGGRGADSEHYASQNDQRMLDLIRNMAAEKVVPEAEQRQNACGAGAIAATIAACKRLGASRGTILEYTNSYRIVHEQYPGDPDDTTVGYASVIFT